VLMQLSNHELEEGVNHEPERILGVHPVGAPPLAVTLPMRSHVKVLTTRIADVLAAFVIAHVWRNPWPRQEDHRP